MVFWSVTMAKLWPSKTIGEYQFSESWIQSASEAYQLGSLEIHYTQYYNYTYHMHKVGNKLLSNPCTENDLKLCTCPNNKSISSFSYQSLSFLNTLSVTANATISSVGFGNVRIPCGRRTNAWSIYNNKDVRYFYWKTVLFFMIF